MQPTALPRARSRAFIIGAVLVCVLLAATSVVVMQLDPGLTWHTGTKTLVLNILPGVAFSLGLWSLMRRAILSLLISMSFVALLYHASTVKANYLGTPLLPSDFWLVSQLVENPGLFADYIDLSTAAITAITLSTAALGLLWRYEPATFTRSWLLRLPMTAASLFLCYAIFAGTPPTQGLYAEQFGGRVKGIWSPSKLYEKSGMINGLGFYAAQARRAVGTPDMAMLSRFDRANSDDLHRRRNAPLPKELPDVYLIQAESLFDPTTIRGLEGLQLMPNWNRLSRHGIHGSLKSPAFGGVTIRAEFESMTGYPMRAFPTVQYPYYGLVRKGINSLPAVMDGFGYSTIVAHPYKSGFWNRKVVMQRLGFEHRLFREELGELEKVGRYAGDDAFFRRLLKLESNGQPRFVFAITMENHGPWLTQKVPPGVTIPDAALFDSLPPDARTELEAYLWHVISGDHALGMFADALMSRSRPTVLAIYGDHLPALKKTFPHVEFVNGKPAHAQPVPFMVISNRPMTPRLVEQGGLNELPALLLHAAKLPQPGYFAIDGLASDHAGAIGRDGTDNLLVQAAWRDYLGAKRAAGSAPGHVAAHPDIPDRAQNPPDAPQASLTISPIASDGCRPNAYTARVDWSIPASVPARRAEIHVHHANGQLMASKQARVASTNTGNWVRPGMEFYLVDGDSGQVLDSAVAAAYRCH